MRKIKLFACAVLLIFMSAAPSVAQPVSGTPASPARRAKQVVEEFWTLETSGKLLTEDGWTSACKYYKQPAGARVRNWSIIVIAPDWSVWPPYISGNAASVMIGLEIIGKVDSQMNFSPHRSEAVKEGVQYAVALTRESCSLGQNGKQVPNVAATPDWRLDRPLGTANMYLSLDAALRYVAEIRDRSPEEAVKTNASATLLRLQRRKKTIPHPR